MNKDSWKTTMTGVFSFPITPFTQDLKLDLEGFRSNIERICKIDFAAVFVCCGAGEFHALSLTEYRSLIQIASEVIANRKPLFAGIGMGPAQACEFALAAEESGANGLLAMPPYLIAPGTQGLASYYQTIGRATQLPMILYQRNNAIFTQESLELLSKEENIIGFKDGHGDLEKFRQFTAHFGDRFFWLNGTPTAEMTFEAYHACGAHGYSSAIANFAPQIALEFYRSTLARDGLRCAQILNNIVIPISQIRKRQEGYAVSYIKAAMNLMGLPAGPVRPPLPELDEKSKQDLLIILQKNNLFIQ